MSHFQRTHNSTFSVPISTGSITLTATPTFSSRPRPNSTPATARIYIKVRDFGFPPTDERHLGLGDDIPKANRVNRLNLKLGNGNEDSMETVGDTDDREEDGEYEEPQEPLYPGLYRALYSFEPEGMAEMELDENQIVRVVGRGGGVGWAVVVDERGDEEGGKVQVKHALVPESYLEAVTLDWLDWEEDEEEGLEVAKNEDGDGNVIVVQAGDA